MCGLWKRGGADDGIERADGTRGVGGVGVDVQGGVGAHGGDSGALNGGIGEYMLAEVGVGGGEVVERVWLRERL